MTRSQTNADGRSGAPGASEGRRFWLFPSRIRSKLIVLHTTFSLALALILLLALRAPVSALVVDAERREAQVALSMWTARAANISTPEIEGVVLERGSPAELELTSEIAQQARATPGAIVTARGASGGALAIRYDAQMDSFAIASVRNSAARSAINRLYVVMTIALLGVYGLIALTLEVFVLPKQVYRPIATLRRADHAVQHGDREHELIDEREIPSDELGEIMHLRNQSVIKLRQQEQALEEALGRLERVAAELKRKNFLLENAKRNIADQDRLVSLGMMSAGLAHELNTPLAVVKGCMEELAASHTRSLPKERIELMARVVSRLEKLSESLLDFARVRPRAEEPVSIARVVEEAWTLVSFDRGAPAEALRTAIDADVLVLGDADRLTQVFVNLLRNAIDAQKDSGFEPVIDARAEPVEREGEHWVSITLTDHGPGIDPAVIDRLFEPFASTRLDARGTGLGLAVAEGIVREHGGVLIARNAPGAGAQFELVLPAAHAGARDEASAGTLTTPKSDQ